MPEVSSTAQGRRPRAVLETEGTVFPYTDRPRLVNNVFIFFLPTDLARQSSQIAFQNVPLVRAHSPIHSVVFTESANWRTYNCHKDKPNSVPKIANYGKRFYQEQGWKIVVGIKELN